MAIQITSSGWRPRAGGTARGTAAASATLPGLPSEFLSDGSRVSDEVVVEPTAATRGAPAGAQPLALTADVPPGKMAMLVIRHPSGALTFHAPRTETSRSRGGPTEVRFIAPIRPNAAGGEETKRGAPNLCLTRS